MGRRITTLLLLIVLGLGGWSVYANVLSDDTAVRALAEKYKLPVDQVFPVGKYFKGGDYGGDVDLPVPQAELNNLNFKGCLDRLA